MTTAYININAKMHCKGITMALYENKTWFLTSLGIS